MPDITVNYEAGAARLAQQLFGRKVSDEELAAAVGALDGATLEVTTSRKGTELSVVVKQAKVLEQVRYVRRAANGELYIWNFRLESAPGFYGAGLESFIRQVKGARALGVKRIECYAAGNPKDRRYRGYYRWALYGYDAPLTQAEQAALAKDPNLAGVRSLNELMLRGGQTWWEANGSERKMIFRLAENSSMMMVLHKYLSDKHPDLLKELA